MLENEFTNVEFSWATVADMKADIKDLTRKIWRKDCCGLCVLM